jgi:hypothetical protein
MVVVIHQAVGMAEPAIARDDMGEGDKEEFPVAVIQQDLLRRGQVRS